MKEQIEEMAKDLRNAEHWYYDEISCTAELDEQKTATNLYNAGYCKQREGEWKVCMLGLDFKCSLCDEKADCFISGYEWDVDYAPPYCPNCGAKMKGGAE